ncbi:YgfZ/GcvT domain-containing protein [Skermania piniformis]|uniref:Folate-binding protein YgfZ n=1 Tax=Skermania pinensis TaxID=39122 RepID=A0ABX8S6N6_9ACTN|nr:folate-binding protein YgfZ [Skermania piniformis]QXQ13469.1 folate-binding protein YgfZ [Skermania piniformis]
MRVSAPPSPLLATAGAVPGPDDTPDSTVAWHYGDPLGEQRTAEHDVGLVDRSHRSVLTITGAERLTWLHTLISQHVADLADGQSAESLLLDANGRVEQHFVLTELAGTSWLDTEAETGPALLDYLRKMVFWADAQPAAADYAVLTLLGPRAATVLAAVGLDPLPAASYAAVSLADGFVRRMPWPTAHAYDLIVPRARLAEWWQRLIAAGARPVGSWAFAALRVTALRPRLGSDTDDRTIPHEVGWIGAAAQGGAVHLDKGCYRGQETVARVHNLGKPPRRLVLLHLDGSADERPEPGTPVVAGGRAVGRLGTVVDHYELGPIALALVKRSIDPTTALTAGPAAVAIDPDSVSAEELPQAGRAAVDRLRGTGR